MAVADQPSEKFSELFEKMALPIVVISVLATILLASFLSPLPNFSTDLSSFAPNTEYDDAKSAIYNEITQSGELIYINIEPSQDDSSVLEIGALQQLNTDFLMIQNYSESNGNFIKSQLNAADILERAIEQSNYSGSLDDFDDWQDLLNSVFENNENCESSFSSDEENVAYASFASSVMLHQDFNFESLCDWLLDGNGNPLPHASSTLWIIEMNGNLDEHENLKYADGIREMLSYNSDDSSDKPLEYGVISDSLISNDINESTLCLLYTSPSPRDLSTSRMPSSA